MAGKSRQYNSTQFVESAGAIFFHLSAKQVCVIHYLAKNEWLLAKGRRNCGESRHQAALREIKEETGYQCHLHPVYMPTRAPPMEETADARDIPQSLPNLTEPFMVTIRELSGADNVKLIFWYIAAVDAQDIDHHGDGEATFRPEFFGYNEAVKRLTFEGDREVLKAAIAIVEDSSK